MKQFALLDWYKGERGYFRDVWDHEGIVRAAARFGSRAILQMAILERKWERCSWVVCEAAAAGGQLEILQWARENDCPWDARTCSGAARGGHFEILKWAHEHECPWDENTCSTAAEYGHLEILKWARENDCPWDKDTCTWAAENDHLDILKWARQNDCPWYANDCAKAASRRGHDEIYEWICENV